MLSPTRLDALARGVARRYHDVPGMDASDLTQEASLAILESAATGESREGWLVMQAHHRLSLIFQRATRRQPVTLTTVPIDHGPTAEDVAAGREAFALLSALSPQQAAVIELGMRQGMSDNETAAALGTTADSVKSSRTKALVRLRRMVTFLDLEAH